MNFLRYYFYYIFLHLTLAGSSLIQIGDAISVNLDSFVTYKHSSNILKSETNEKSDGLYIISPGAVVNFGKPGTAFDLKLKANYDIIQYQDYSDLDINLSKLYLNGSYNPSERLNNSFSYSNFEGQTARSELSVEGAPALVETSSESASFSTSYQYSPKLSFSLGVNQRDLKYDTYTDQLASKKSTTIPFNLIYQYSNKLSVVYGVSLTETEIGERKAYFLGNQYIQPAYETDSVYYNIGLRGTILPKLTGQFDVGYRTLSFSTNTNDFNAFGATSALSWTLTPKLRTTLNLSRDFDAAGSGSTYRLTKGNLSTVYSINSEFKLSLNLGRTGKYFKSNSALVGGQSGRGETLTNISLNLHYIPSENYSFIAGYNTVRSDAITDYDLKEFRLTAKLKY